MDGFLRTFRHRTTSLQTPFEVAVVMPSILRPLIADALRSVLAQAGPRRIQVLVGLDHAGDDHAPPDLGPVEAACADIGPDRVVQVFHPGYSTSVRHGGLHPARDGGALRAVLTLLANSDRVAYLDDDNRWTPDHLPSLLAALGDGDWAYGLRWFVHHRTGRQVSIDEWESVGPDRGLFREMFGGFVDPNTLLIDRRRCLEAIVAWTTPLPNDPKAMSADRMVFDRLRRLDGRATGRPTALYRLDPEDGLHARRLAVMGDAYEA